MPRFRIVLVRPENEGNIGAVARAMANFDMSELYLVSPVKIGDEGRKRAKHGNFILDSAVIVTQLDDALKGCDTVVGTTGIRNTGERRFLRNFETPHGFAQYAANKRRTFAILFGPEGLGLSNPELGSCDMLISIPTSEKYPVMNLSHAVSVILYELFLSGYEPYAIKRSVELDRKKVNEYFALLLDAVDYPSHKREKARLMFRRLIGRANMSKWEFFIMMGVLSKTLRALSENEG
jgi:TrmH family RNA methyltransferase